VSQVPPPGADIAGGIADDFADPNAGNGWASTAPPADGGNAGRNAPPQGNAVAMVDEDAFNRGMNNQDAQDNFRIDGDYPQAEQLTIALNSLRAAIAEQRRQEEEYHREQQRRNIERIRLMQYQWLQAKRAAEQRQQYYEAQRRAYINWLAQHQRAQRASQAGQNHAAGAGHRAGGAINDKPQ
jgi:hypothetical protein